MIDNQAYVSDAEAALEERTVALFTELGWETVNAHDERFSEMSAGPRQGPYLGRANRLEVVLGDRLRRALQTLNPDLPPEARHLALDELTRSRATLSRVRANRQVYRLLKDGVSVTFRDDAGDERTEMVRVIDWQHPKNNEFLLVQQFWVTGDTYTRRPDLVGFVNGLPLFVAELKAHYRDVKLAYERNLSDYKDTIPHLLWYNAFILLSNGSDARVGTITSPWEHFSPWKKRNSEDELGRISLETAVRGTCHPARFLDLVENYVLYSDRRGELHKILAKYHQYLGVQNTIDAVHNLGENQGRLGVFWHTQGSGKSFSMLFFSRKVLRKLPGNWTFVIVTDRIELDEQIYKAFARADVLHEPEERIHAESGAHLRELLKENHRYVFTLIHKFHTWGVERYPVLSERPDIIVMTDEAHRTQYDVLAMNMRRALPNAAFIGFTATPLMADEEKTRQVFGDYVSVYDFQKSVADGATVPLYYENRIPELQLTNEHFNEEMDRLLERAELNDAEERKLSRAFGKEYHLITRDQRLETIAEDLVDHFVNRGYLGKGMVVSIDKVTTGRMYKKVKKHWGRKLEALREEYSEASDMQKQELEGQIRFMETTEMAVVISQGQGEVQKFAEHGIDILPIRRRIQNEDLDERFKDPEDPLRLAFLCAKWRTGFDAPCCSTIYLDRPMRNHTLMQTIARANRVFGDKVCGLIVDYIGIFRDLQRALAIYGSGVGGTLTSGETPVKDKEALLEELREAIQKAVDFLGQHDIKWETLLVSDAYQRVERMDDAVDKLLVNDDTRDRFIELASQVTRLFKAILPDTQASEFEAAQKTLSTLADKLRLLRTPKADISGVMADVEGLLDRSVAAHPYVIEGQDELYDLSSVDIDALRDGLEQDHKRTKAQQLRGALNAEVKRMVRRNPTRIDYMQELQRLIDEYNNGSRNVESFLKALINFTEKLQEEKQRHVREGLSEEELAVFDILVHSGPDLSRDERKKVKQVARQLLNKLKEDLLVLDWRKRQQSCAKVEVAIRDELYQELPTSYTGDMCQEKVGVLYQHVYEKYWGPGESVYSEVA